MHGLIYRKCIANPISTTCDCSAPIMHCIHVCSCRQLAYRHNLVPRPSLHSRKYNGYTDRVTEQVNITQRAVRLLLQNADTAIQLLGENSLSKTITLDKNMQETKEWDSHGSYKMISILYISITMGIRACSLVPRHATSLGTRLARMQSSKLTLPSFTAFWTSCMVIVLSTTL